MSSSKIPHIIGTSPHNPLMTSSFVLVGKSAHAQLSRNICSEQRHWRGCPDCPFYKGWNGGSRCILWCINIYLYVCVTGVHRYARWIGGISHQSSDLSHPCNLLWKVVICALLNTRFKGMQVVTHLTNYQTTKVMSTKKFPKRVWIHAHE